MALAQAAALVEKVIGHGDNATTEQDNTNPGRDRAKYADPSGEMMKALVWMGKNTVEVRNVPKPRVVEDRDVILQVTGSTVCGSDLHLLHGSVIEMEKGDILGHEFCGVVESMGSGVKNLSKGDRVVASFQIACGDCFYCKKKMSSQCEKTNSNTLENGMYGGRTAGMFGYSHFTGGFAGGQAEVRYITPTNLGHFQRAEHEGMILDPTQDPPLQKHVSGAWLLELLEPYLVYYTNAREQYVRVPYGDVNLLKLPDSVPDEKGLYLSDVICTSWNCVVDTGVEKGDVVAIWGAGPIGQMCADFAFINGASRVIMIDQNWRLEYVKSKYPKVELLDFSSLPRGASVTSRLKEMVDGRGPDVALECVAGEYAKGWAHYFELMLGMETDSSEIVNEMITSVRNFGRCGITGVYVGFTNHFNIGALMERGIRLIGNGQAPVHMYWEKLCKMIESGEIDPLKMVSHRVSMDELAEVYYKFEKKEDGMQKVFVETKFSAPPAPGSPSLTTYTK